MESVEHTWYQKHAHIFRTDGRVVRATVLQLVLEHGAIYLKVEFLDTHGVRKTKDVSPLTVACLQILWENVDVVSDMELPDDMEQVTDFVPPRECDHLPALAVSFVQTPAMKCMLLQVNHFVALSSPASLPAMPVSVPLLPSPRRRRRRSTRRRKGTDTGGARWCP